MDDGRLRALEAQVRLLTAQLTNMVTRGTLLQTEDDDGAQSQNVFGFYGEQIEGVKSWQPFGLSAVAPPGSDILILSMGGNRDGAQALMAGDPSLRPTGAQIGETVLYDAAGQTVKLGADGIVITDASGSTITMNGGKVTIIADDVEITGNLTNNGVNVGSTHTHTDSVGLGAGNTSGPK